MRSAPTRFIMEARAVEGDRRRLGPAWSHRMRHFLRTAFLLASLMLGTWPSVGSAGHPLQMLSQYSHRAWRVQEGTLPLPTAIAQTRDGYLWIGTKTGLLRFDGVRFVEADVSGQESLRGVPIWSLLATRNGDLWVGAPGFVARIREGRSTRFKISGRALQMIADGEAIWFVQSGATDNSAIVCGIVGETLTCHGAPDIPLDGASSISKATDGFWIGSTAALCHWIPGSVADCFLQGRLAPYRSLMGINSVEALPDRSV